MVDFVDQFLHAAEGSPTDGLLRDAIEPDLHLIQPGCIGRSKVHMEAGARGKPAPDSQMLVGSVIIHDDVHVQILRHVLFDLPEKTQIFLMPVARPALR